MSKLEDGKNGYWIEDLKCVVPRVTSVIGAFVPEELIRWFIRRSAERALYWRIRLPNNKDAVAQAITDVESSPEAEKGTFLHSILEAADTEEAKNRWQQKQS